MAQFSTVVAITGNGTVYAMDVQGNSRVLKVGDALQKGETVRTVGDVRVELMMEDGHLLAVAPAQSVLLDDHVTQSDQSPTAQDSAVTTTPATIETVIQALERGADLNQELEATAAGLAGGGANDGGNSFVQLLRITEGVEPLAYSYSFAAPSLPPDLPVVPEQAVAATLQLTAEPSVFEGSQGITYTGTLGQPAITDMIITLSNGAVILIPAGSTTGTVLVPVQGDDVYKDGETIQATVGTVEGGGFSSVTVNDSNVITVVNDTIDTVLIKVSIAAEGPVTEAETANFRVSVSQVLDRDLTVTLSDGHTVVIKAGEQSALYSVAPQGDDVYKDPGNVILSLTDATVVSHTFENLQLGPEAATINIIDTINVVTLGITGPASVTEGNVASPYTLTLSDPAQTDVVVNLTYSGQALDGTAFVGVATVTIPAGASTATFSIATLDDSLFEGAETFNVTITSASGGNFESLKIDAATSNVNTTIVDNDPPVFTLIGDATVVEGTAAHYAIALTGASLAAGQSVILTIGTGLTVDTATEGVDYNSHDGTLTVTAPVGGWAIGAQVASFTVQTTDDSVDEANETFTVQLTASSIGTANGSVITTIVDNDAPTIVVPGIETQDVVVTEGNDAVFTVNVTGAAAGSSVSLMLADGTALDADYHEAYFQYSTDGGTSWSAVSGAISVPAGDSTLQVKTDTYQDLVDENDEIFTLTGTLSSLGVDYSASATATIVDNDTAPPPPIVVPGIETQDVVVTEGNDAVFTVNVTGAAAGSSVSLTLADGTALDADYHEAYFQYSTDGGTSWSAVSGAISVPAGDSTLQVKTDTYQDLVDENDEIFTLTGTLSSLGVDYSDSDSATATIVDNDVPPTIADSSVNVSEEGLAGGNPDTVGSPDTTNEKTITGTIAFTGNGTAPLTVALSLAGLPSYQSGGENIIWSYDGTNNAVVLGKVGGSTVIQITLNGGSTSVDMSGPTPPTSLGYEVQLLGPVDHPDDAVEDVLSFNVSVTVSDGVNPADGGTIAIAIEDDAPSMIYAESVHIENQATATTVTAALNFIAGEDGIGTVVFDLVGLTVGQTSGTTVAATDNDGHLLKIGGQQLYLYYGGVDGTDTTILLAKTLTGTVGFTLDIDPATMTGQYTFNPDAIVSNGTEVLATNLAGVGAGNVTFKLLIDVGGMQQDVAMTTAVGSTINSDADDIGISKGQTFTAGEVLRFDLVNGLTLIPGSGNTPDTYSYDGTHNEVVRWKQQIQITGNVATQNADIKVTAINAGTDSTFYDPAFAGDVRVELTAANVRIYNASNQLVDPATYAANEIAVTDATDPYAVEITGLKDDWYYEIVTDDAHKFDAIQVDALTGTDAFSLGLFSYGIDSPGTPIDLTYDIVGTDGDGDQIGGNINVSLYPDPNSSTGSNLTGDASDNILIGTSGADTLSGAGGNDLLIGSANGDVLIGGGGNDVLIGGSGNDTLTGGAGADTFKWTLGDALSTTVPVDHVTDFMENPGDKLDLRDLLEGMNAPNEAIDNYLSFSTDGTDTTITIKSQGTGGAVDQTVVLDDVNLIALAGSNDAQTIVTYLGTKIVID